MITIPTATFIRSRVSRFLLGAATIGTAGVLAFGGFVPVGAQATGTYDCGTYGGGNYDQTDCTDSSTTTSSGGSSSSSSSSSSSVHSGSTASGSSSSTSTILLNDYSEYRATTGKSLGLTKGEAIYFNLNGEKHTITIKDFTASSLTVTIASTPTDVSVPVGQTVNYDVDQDGTPDIAVTYNQLASDNASVTATFRALTTAAAAPSTTTGGSSTDNSAGGSTAPATGSSNAWWVWIIPIIIGVGLLITAIAVVIRRRRNANNTTPTGGTTFNQF